MTTDLLTVADELRAEVARVLRPLADLAAPVRDGSDAPWDQLVRIRLHEVRRAADCPASLAHLGEFEGWRTAFARRRLGLVVLEKLRKGARDPTAVAIAALDDLVASGRGGFEQWLAELNPGGRATVVREAVGFAVAARIALHASWPPDGTRFVAAPWRWQVPGRAVALEASVDAVAVHRGERGTARSLLVLGTDEVDERALRLAVAWPALVCALRTGQVPLRVTRIDLADGARRSFTVTDDVLDDGLTAAAAAVGAAMAARFSGPARPVPGRWCRRCPGRDSCPVAV